MSTEADARMGGDMIAETAAGRVINRRSGRYAHLGMNSDGFTFVDSHVHFWDGARIFYPWLAEVPAIAAPHTPAELETEAGARVPREIVVVEADADPAAAPDELHWVEELADRHPQIAAIVAQVAVDGDAQTDAALASLAGHARVRGVRHLIQGHAATDYCLRPSFVAGVRRVGERGWTFDLCVRHAQLPACIELVRACSGTTFVLDHAGKPDIRRGRLDPWRAHIAELSDMPNVVCKLSGLVTEADPATWTPPALRPYVDHLLASFGPDRLLFGSDWPVVKLAASYQRWLETARELLAPLSPRDRAAVFAGNARRIYRLDTEALAA
jgi:L-fuconolactonase